MEITQQELFNVLSQVDKPTFIYLEFCTPVRMVVKDRETKIPNPYLDRITKTTKGNFYIGGEYERRVNMNLTKEGKEPTFESQPMSGQVHLTKCVTTDTKTQTKHYLMFEFFEETPPFEVSYVCDENDPIEKHMFQQYMSESSKPTNQNLDRTVNVRTVLLSNIRVLHMNGFKYEIRPQTHTDTVEV